MTTVPGNTVAPATAPGFSAAAAPPEPGRPAGPFAALLDTVTDAIRRATRNDSKAPDAPPAAPSDAAAPSPAAGRTGSETGHDGHGNVLGKLASAIAAVDKALKKGEKPDEETLARLDAAVEALIGILGLAPTGPAAANPSAGPSESFTLAAGTLLDLLSGPKAGLPPKLAEFMATRPAAVSGLAVDVDPKTVLTGLSTRLGEMAEALQEADPQLAAKLARVGDALGDRNLGHATLEQLGFKPEAASAPSKLATVDPATNLARPSLDAQPPAPQPATDDSTKPAPAPAGPDKSAPTDRDTPKDKASLIARATADAGAPDKPASNAAGAPTQSALPPAPASGQASIVPAGLRPVQAAYQPPPGPINLPQFAFVIAHQAAQGINHFQVRLDPPDLGRVDVSMRLDGSGNLNAHMTVERSETLDLMQRDRSQLERALAQAGLDAGRTNLQFSLNQNPFSGQNPAPGHQPSFSRPGRPAGMPADPAQVVPAVIYRGSWSAGGINLFV
ncbi:MAG TPA: flagellar hook-length control protein FliK [Limnochordia bacterium]|nr:flagellar hook-length control protein FliK [Limnochordia bacterium]